MHSFRNKYQGGEYSQNGEAGIIDECLRRLKINSGTAVEFGAPTKKFCSNIFHLGPGWRKVYIDPSPQEEGIIKGFVTPENVNEMIPECQVLSIDIDGNDYNVWKAYEGYPDIVIIEINSSLPPYMDVKSDPAHGSSYYAMTMLGIEKKYFLLTHTGNLIFILRKHRELFPEVEGLGISNHVGYFKTDWI